MGSTGTQIQPKSRIFTNCAKCSSSCGHASLLSARNAAYIASKSVSGLPWASQQWWDAETLHMPPLRNPRHLSRLPNCAFEPHQARYVSQGGVYRSYIRECDLGVSSGRKLNNILPINPFTAKPSTTHMGPRNTRESRFARRMGDEPP